MSNRINICLNDGEPIIVDSDQSPQKFSTAAKCLLLCLDAVQPLDLLGTDDPRSVNDTLAKHEAAIEKFLAFFEDFFEAFVDEHGTESLSESLNAIKDRSSSCQRQLVYLDGRVTKVESAISFGERLTTIEDRAMADYQLLSHRLTTIESSVTPASDQNVGHDDHSKQLRHHEDTLIARFKAIIDKEQGAGAAEKMVAEYHGNVTEARAQRDEDSEYITTNLASDLTDLRDRVKVVETRCITSLNDTNKILSRLNVLEDDTSSTSDELYDRIKKIEDCIRVQADQHVSAADRQNLSSAQALLDERLTKLEDSIKAHVDQREATRLTEAAARNSLNIRLAKVEASEYLARDLASDLAEITDRIRQMDDCIRVHVDQQVSTELNTAADRQAIAAAVASLCERLNIIHSAVMESNTLEVDILKNINGRLSVIEKARGYTHKKVPPPLDDGNDIDIDDGA